MPRISKIPESLEPYVFLGADLDPGSKEAMGECPFCGSSRFSVSVTKGLFKCWSCKIGPGDKQGGGPREFVQCLHSDSFQKTSTTDYRQLCDNRGFKHETTLVEWNLAKSSIDGAWLVPGWSAERKLVTLYKYQGGTLYPTPTLGSAIFGANLYDPGKEMVFLNEGPWDPIILWETMRECRYDEKENLVPTSSLKDNLLADANVLGVPGCGAIGRPMIKWLPLFKDKQVILMFDNDHERQRDGKLIKPAALEATKRAAAMLDKVASEVSFLRWGEKGWTEDLAHGRDVRDELLCRR